jgi:uncharacterized protein
MLRELPATMDSAVVAKIDARLASIRQGQRVEIPLAIESGSRAWGFPSPDSDYDCRFIFVRPTTDYLSLWPERDVIETPLDKVLDVNGWDLAKAVKLLLKGNATVIEWLTSPISYGTDATFREEFLQLARTIADRAAIGRHYLHLGERQLRTYFRTGKPIAQKKILYALRPAAALRWLRYHPKEAVAPMHFPTLMAGCSPPGGVSKIVQTLIARKAATRELGLEVLPEPIRQFIDREFEHARDVFDIQLNHPSAEARRACNEFFVATAQRYST